MKILSKISSCLVPSGSLPTGEGGGRGRVLSLLLLGFLGFFTSCSDMLETDSSMIEFAEQNKLNSSRDTVSSLMGVVRGIQTIADRTFILGDIRSDQVVITASATTAIKQIANFEVDAENPYNKVSDYYAIINNCNYYIANADTALVKLGKKVFEKEYAAIKTYRAWTYLQLVKNYGQVPLVLDPVLTEAEATAEMNKTYSDINTICNYFIEDIKPYVDTESPAVIKGDIQIPVRVLLGELCLWAGRYNEAAQYLHEYLTMKNDPVPTGLSGKILTKYGRLDGTLTNWNPNDYTFKSSEMLCYMLMATSDYEGVKSELSTVYQSVLANNYYAQIEPSQALKKLSADQNYVFCIEASQTERDTIYVEKGGWPEEFVDGDLRLYCTLSRRTVNVDEASPFSRERITNTKASYSYSRMWFYRVQQVYLMYAEALNRLGCPEAALCVLKYGLRNQNIERYVSEKEREKAGTLLDFDDEVFTKDNTLGVHARGCGDVDCDKNYCVPQPPTALASYEDTVQYQIPLVEQMIIDEYGLEFTFEGKRFYDLMRIALRRNDPAYLADAVAKRNGKIDDALREKLMDKRNWFLPLR
jgi:tetratricopeptide (TPR) repeat protein